MFVGTIYPLVSAKYFPFSSYKQVPPLLGVFYCTVGLFQLYLDERAPPNSIPPAGSLEKAALSLMSVFSFPATSVNN